MSKRALAAACLAATMAAPAIADDFYKGRTISIIVGASPGGGHDAYARALARHMVNHIPGKPSMIVQNMPSAGNMGTARALVTTQAKDGTVIAALNAGVLTQSAMQPELVNLDFRKFAWIGVVTPAFSVCYGYGDKGPGSWDEMMKRPQFIVGTTAKGSLSYTNSSILKEIFNAPVKLIMGYPGSSESRLALERGELDGDCGEFTVIAPDWIETKRAKTFVRFTKERPSNMPESARFINDFTKTQEQRDVLDLLNVSNELGRPIVMAGEVSPELVGIIRKAFDETMLDKDYLAESARQMLPVNPISGPEAAKVIDRMMASSPTVVAKARKIYD